MRHLGSTHLRYIWCPAQADLVPQCPSCPKSKSRAAASRRSSPAASSPASRCASRGCAGRCRAEVARPRRAHGAGRCTGAASTCCVDCGDGHLILHLGMSGSLRVLPPGTPPGKHDHFDLSSATAFCGCAIRAASARCCGPPGDAEHAPAARAPGHRAAVARRSTRARLHALTRGQRTADQAVPDGRAAHRRRRQHLRQREPVPRRHPPAHARRPAVARALRELSAADQADAAARRSAPAAPACATSSARDGSSGYFQQRHWVYDRDGQPCRRCGAAIRRIVQGQRSTFFCPALPEASRASASPSPSASLSHQRMHELRDVAAAARRSRAPAWPR